MAPPPSASSSAHPYAPLPTRTASSGTSATHGLSRAPSGSTTVPSSFSFSAAVPAVPPSPVASASTRPAKVPEGFVGKPPQPTKLHIGTEKPRPTPKASSQTVVVTPTSPAGDHTSENSEDESGESPVGTTITTRSKAKGKSTAGGRKKKRNPTLVHAFVEKPFKEHVLPLAVPLDSFAYHISEGLAIPVRFFIFFTVITSN